MKRFGNAVLVFLNVYTFFCFAVVCQSKTFVTAHAASSTLPLQIWFFTWTKREWSTETSMNWESTCQEHSCLVPNKWWLRPWPNWPWTSRASALELQQGKVTSHSTQSTASLALFWTRNIVPVCFQLSSFVFTRALLFYRPAKGTPRRKLSLNEVENNAATPILTGLSRTLSNESGRLQNIPTPFKSDCLIFTWDKEKEMRGLGSSMTYLYGREEFFTV